MDNFKLKENHQEVLSAQMERIEVLNHEIENLDNRKEGLIKEFEQEKQMLENKLQTKYERREELNQQVKDMTGEIARLNVTRNYLH